MRLLLASLVVFLLPATNAADETKWVRVKAGDYLFVADFPDQPETRQRKSDSPVGSMDSTIIARPVGDTHVYIVVTRLPRAARWLAPESVLRSQARKQLISNRKYREISTTETSRSGVEGEIMEYDYTDEQGRQRRGRTEFFIIDGALVMPSVTHLDGEGQAVRDRFFSTLVVGPELCRKRGTDSPKCRFDSAVAKQ